jgi:hypothetical protein
MDGWLRVHGMSQYLPDLVPKPSERTAVHSHMEDPAELRGALPPSLSQRRSSLGQATLDSFTELHQKTSFPHSVACPRPIYMCIHTETHTTQYNTCMHTQNYDHTHTRAKTYHVSTCLHTHRTHACTQTHGQRIQPQYTHIYI